MIWKKKAFGLMLFQHIMANLNENESTYRNCRRMGIGYHHRIFKEMEHKGWIIITKKGRANKMKLTESGKRIKELCSSLQKELKRGYKGVNEND